MADTVGRARRLDPFVLASRYIGTRELPGGLDNPHILAWLMDAGVADPRQASQMYHDEVAWCGCFVRHIAHLAGLPIPQLPARARSWLTVGKPIPLDELRIGWDIVVLQRGDGLQPGPEVLAASGHVGFFAGFDVVASAPLAPRAIRLLAGNQGDAVNVRAMSVARVLGVRRLLEDAA